MWSSPKVLGECAKLKEAGYKPRFKPGSKVARQFADLGVEEFCVLPQGKLLSLLTGDVAELKEADKEFFFAVPSVDDMAEEIEQRSFNIISLCFEDRRRWRLLVVREGGGGELTAEGGSLEEVFLAALRLILRGS